MRVLAVTVLFCALTAGCATDDPDPGPTATAARGERATVTRVVDGDTIEVTVNGREERVRLIGINTPERGECFYDESTAALDDLVGGREVQLRRDTSDRDDYGRLLRYVEVGDTFVNEALVRNGHAISRRYEPDAARQDVLDRAQGEAHAAQRGLWAPAACGRPVASGEGLEIARIEHDPPGDDTLDLNAEFVVIANPGPDDVAIGGWTLRDESASHRFDFPAGTVLLAGSDLTVHSGCGEATPVDLFWCIEGSAIWNNDGDTAFLLDPAGNIVASRGY